MSPIIWFSILGVSCLIEIIQHFIVSMVNRGNDTPKLKIEQFSGPAYFDRMEKAALDILENQEHVDQTIILWWGLDGLRLNEDGDLEWVSRKNKTLQSNGLSQYESEMEKLRELYRMASQINAPGLAMQTIMSQMQTVQNAAIISQLRPSMMQCCVQYLVQYPSYYYGGCCRLN